MPWQKLQFCFCYFYNTCLNYVLLCSQVSFSTKFVVLLYSSKDCLSKNLFFPSPLYFSKATSDSSGNQTARRLHGACYSLTVAAKRCIFAEGLGRDSLQCSRNLQNFLQRLERDHQQRDASVAPECCSDNIFSIISSAVPICITICCHGSLIAPSYSAVFPHVFKQFQHGYL